VIIDAGEQGNLLLSSTTHANGFNGNGGHIQKTGKNISLLNADISAIGTQDGGTIHLGGEWQGSGLLRHAETLIAGPGTQISATGENGTGGEVVVWSVDKTDFLGSVDAFGCTAGRIEISSVGNLAFDGKLNPGDGGQVLFDPKNILVSDIYMAWVNAITSPEASNSENFGIEVASKGDLLAIGATGHNSYRGAVYLFTGMNSLSGSGFAPTYVKKLSIGVGLANSTSVPTIAGSERFGSGIGIDPNNGVIAVGAIGYTSYQGRVLLFKNAGSDYSGLEYVDFVASERGGMPELNGNDYFGSAIDFDGTGNMAVGSERRAAGGNNNAGAVFMFSGVGTDFSGLTYHWELNNQTKPAALNLPTNHNQLGVSLAFSGSNLIVGSTGQNNYGNVYFFSGIEAANTAGSAESLTWHGRQGSYQTETQSSFGRAVTVQGDLLFVASNGQNLTNPSGTLGNSTKYRQLQVYSGVNDFFAGAPGQNNPFTNNHIVTLSELLGGALDMPNLVGTGFANSMCLTQLLHIIQVKTAGLKHLQ